MAKKEQKEIPLGVKIISVLNYVNAVLSVLIGLLFIILALTNYNITIPETGEQVSTIAIVVLSVLLIIVGVISFFIGRGLWKGQNWARITSIILSAIGVVFAAASLTTGGLSNAFGLVINVIVAGYLAFNKKVKKAFS